MAIGGLAAGALSGSAGAAATPAEKSQATKALVTLSDLPQGWTSGPAPSTSAAGVSGSSQLARCIGVPTRLVADNPPREQSPIFTGQGGTELVQDTVSIYASAAEANAVYRVVANRKAAGCLSSLLNSASATSKSPLRTTVARVESPRGTVAFTLGEKVTSGTTSTPTTTEVLYFFKGQYGNGLDIETSGKRAPAALVAHLLAVARARL
jgi:hypothetical protein